jgi:hypothetical protein
MFNIAHFQTQQAAGLIGVRGGVFDKSQPREAIHGTVRASQEKRDFDPEKFLATIGAGEVVAFPKRQRSSAGRCG